VKAKPRKLLDVMLPVSGKVNIGMGSYILTNCRAYHLPPPIKKRFCIEEMFRDYKSGGYNQGTGVSDERLITMILPHRLQHRCD